MPRSRLPTAERKQQIAEATLHILATRGATALTAAEIARACGVTDGSLFRHFESMEGMVDAAIALFERWLAADFPDEDAGSPIVRLERFFLSRLTRVRERPVLIALATGERLAEVAGEAGARRVRRVVRRSVDFIRTTLEEAQRHGEITADVPVEVLVWMVTGALRGAAGGGLHASAKGGRGGPPEEIWSAVARVLGRAP